MKKQNSYLSKDNKIIRNNLKSYLIYFNHFSSGLRLPKIIDCKTTRFITHKLLNLGIILSYLTKLHYLRYKKINLDENFIVKITGKGQWSNEITLIEKEKKFKILKKVKDNKILEIEEKFYNKVKNMNFNHIKIPTHIFHKKENTIEMDFILEKTFTRNINEGLLSFKESIEIFDNIFNDLEDNTKKLSHGDLGTANILIDKKNKNYYLIDYSESFEYTYEYDLYTLLRNIFINYNKIDRKTNIIASKFEDDIRVKLQLSKEELKKIENLFSQKRKEKHPDIY